jgi:hypothetical protein
LFKAIADTLILVAATDIGAPSTTYASSSAYLFRIARFISSNSADAGSSNFAATAILALA